MARLNPPLAPSRMFALILAVAVLAIMALTGGGCAAFGGDGAVLRDAAITAGQAFQDVDAGLTSAREQLAASPDADPAVIEQLEAVQEGLAQLRAVGDQLAAHFSASDGTPEGDLRAAGAAAVGIAPATGPAAPYLLLGGTLLTTVGGIVQAVRERKRAAAVVRAIEQAKEPNGVVDFSDGATKAKLRAAMGPDARKLVEHVRGS